MHTYLKSLLASTLITVLIVTGLNWCIDPFGIWHNIRIPGLNAYKPEQASHERLFKFSTWASHPTAGIILGTSRAAIGLDPQHPGFANNTFNLGISAQPLVETQELLEWAGSQTTLQQLVYAADFGTGLLSAASTDTISPQKTLRTAATLDALYSSIKTVMEQSPMLIRERGALWLDNGMRQWDHSYVRATGGHRKLTLLSESGYVSDFYNISPTIKKTLSTKERATEACYRRIFSLAHQNHIDLRIAISPIHARHVETILVSGLYHQYEDWKRMLVRINEDEAKLAGRIAFPLWDFSGHNSITTEEFPAANDAQSQMQWYWDSSHYKVPTGSLMLDRVFESAVLDRNIPADFGILLNSQMIEEHLQKLRFSRDRWREIHHTEVTEIANLAKIH